MAALTREQLAELVPCGVEDVARLEQLGLLSPGLSRPVRLHRVEHAPA